MATAQSSTQVLRFPALPAGRLWKRAPVKRAFAGHTLYRLGVLITLFWVGVALLAPWIALYSGSSPQKSSRISSIIQYFSQLHGSSLA